ncbi:shikimate dehydrogenase [uncultured Roseibium sp.]|uniref:shikimate dehydrogenase n=1 Tax=uncultured Roseibium sp. TaxID=1936171 RepID=UPI00374D92C8
MQADTQLTQDNVLERKCLTASEDMLLAGLVGRGIQRSRTPEMHMAEASAHGIRSVYKIIDFDVFSGREPDLAEILSAAEMTGFNGLNVTYPFKIQVVPLLDQLSANAKAVGSVNTVVFRDGRRYGHNTDLWGFAESFRRGMEGAARRKVLLIGAGGAGVAVAHALADLGIENLLVFDIDPIRAARLVAQLKINRPATTTEVVDHLDAGTVSGLDGIVNATPIGMAKAPGSAFPAELLDQAMWVADIVYFPLETQLLKDARKIGCRILPGSGMAIFQASRSFELLTDRPADPERLKTTFDNFVEPGGT